MMAQQVSMSASEKKDCKFDCVCQPGSFCVEFTRVCLGFLQALWFPLMSDNMFLGSLMTLNYF